MRGPAAASLLLAALGLLEYAGLFPRFSGGIMAMQFLVIHSSAFVATLPYWNIKEEWKPAAFKALLGLYALFAFSMDGLFGIAEFAALTYATYHGYVFSLATPRARTPLLLRWACAFALFLAAVGLAGAPSAVEHWPGNRRLGLAVFLYFLPYGLLELADFYEEGWRRLLRRLLDRQPELKRNLPAALAEELYGEKKKD